MQYWGKQWVLWDPKGRLSEKVMLPLTFENTSKNELDGVGERNFRQRGEHGRECGHRMWHDMRGKSQLLRSFQWLTEEDGAKGRCCQGESERPNHEGFPCILRFCRETGGLLKAFKQMSHMVSFDFLDKLWWKHYESWIGSEKCLKVKDLWTSNCSVPDKRWGGLFKFQR